MFDNFNLREWILEALYRIPGILIGLSFHEWAHAYAAYKRGDPTARNLGRMTVNPIAHLDPIGIVMLLVAGFGWARPVPVNPRNFKEPRKDEIIVSLAGVTTNLIIAFVFMGIAYLVSLFTQSEVAYVLLLYTVYINVGLFVFNLIPVPPLDGYHVFQALFARHIGYRFFQAFERYGNYILIAIVLGGGGILTAAIGGVVGLIDGFYTMLFGLFI
ncbi:MAG TPA: site-2 protease family protein [Clostridia bacterium]|nr:site-2 protease family protein [Clostridia bacterium]HPK16253.1 site-2 protease family protein [Clostridia bacterium]